MPKEINLSAPLPHQIPLLDSPSRYKLARWGRRAGKTDTSQTALVIGHGPINKLGRPKYKGAAQGGHMLWLAPSYPQSAVIWERALVPMCSGVPGVTINEAKKTVIFAGGGSILVRSAEAIDNIRGMNFDGIIIDEGAFIDLKYIWNSVLLPSLTDRRGWAIVISTPKMGSYFNELCENEQDGKLENWAQFHARTVDNKALPEDAVAELYASYPPESTELQEELEAELISERGALFSRDFFDRKYTDVTKQSILCPAWSDQRIELTETILIVDLAASLKQSADYTVVMVAGITKPVAGVRRSAIIDVTRKRIDGPDQIKLVGELIKEWRPSKVLVETVGYQLTAVQHLRKTYPYTQIVELKPKGDKRARAMGFAACLSRGEVAFPADAKWFKDYLVEHLKFTGDGRGHDDMVDVGSYLAAYVLRPSFSARPRLVPL